MLNAGSRATRKIFPNALILVHFTNPERDYLMIYFADELNNYNLDYDVFSTSYYPYWHGTLDNLKYQLDKVSTKYNKKIFIAESSYPYTRDNLDFFPNKDPGYTDILYYPMTIQGQANHVRNLIEKVSQIKNGIWLSYWEGAWIAVGTTSYYENKDKWEKYGSGWATSYSADYNPSIYSGGGNPVENQALFDSKGKPLESLKIFNLVKYGNDVEIIDDAVVDISINPVDFSNFNLPETIEIIDISSVTRKENIIWDDNFNLEKAKTEENYEYNGKTKNIDLKCNFQNNTNSLRKLVCNYYSGEKYLSPWREVNLITIREL